MKLLLIAILATAGIAATTVFAASAAPAAAGPAPVLLELFTSEGCSSCPPADRLLEALDQQPVAGAELIVVSEHVDYWNSLGWRDPYSSAFFSDRQHRYSERLGATVYTPQLVIDGQFQMVGSDQKQVLQTIAKATQRAKLPVSIRAADPGRGALHVEANSGGMRADLYIVVAADRARSQVLRGENGGHTLTHVAVAQSITKIGKWAGAGEAARDVPVPGKLTGQAGKTRVIAILVDPRSGRVLGAAQTRI